MDAITAQLEASRHRLLALAHRMLGSRVEAEDAVQETWLKVRASEPDDVMNVEGWLTTITTRVCLDRLRARRARPEGAEAEASAERIDDRDPADAAVLSDTVGAALLVVLEVLPPAERVAFVLHDVFAVPFDSIAEMLDRSPDAARKLASRARRRVQGAGGRSVDLVRHREVVEAFLSAAQTGDFERLLRVLDPNVTVRTDAAAARMGAPLACEGAAEVAASFARGAAGARLAVIDGKAGLAWAPGGQVRGVLSFTTAANVVVAIELIAEPERLDRLEVVTLN